jgi:uncharacterized protein (DUF2336 family)
MSELQTHLAPRFASLARLGEAGMDSGARRELLRQVTEALDAPGQTARSPEEIAQFDEALAAAAADYSKQVRAEIARLVASQAGLSKVAESFAFDDIEVAGPILRRSSALSEATLLKVVHGQSQEHLMAVSKRAHVSETLSQALVDKGDDHVVSSLLANDQAQIGLETYDRIAQRAETSAALQAPLVRRQGVPPELLNTIYLKAEASLKREILAKMENIPAADMEAAFARSRARVTDQYARPADFQAQQRRIDAMDYAGTLKPATLVKLLREGKASRTAFTIALARICDMAVELVERVVENHDIDTVALLCRGSGVERAVFVTLAVALDADPNRALAGATHFMALYDSVPPAAAERALRFWKIKAAA